MKTVLAIVPYYLPYPGGAERSMHEMLRRLVQLGISAEALVPLDFPAETSRLLPEVMRLVPVTESIDGVLVRRLKTQEWINEVADRSRNADLVFFTLAHLFRRRFNAQLDLIMKNCRQRVVYFCRGQDPADYFPGALVVANSQAVLDGLPERQTVRTCLLKPLISIPRAQPARSRRWVTLINPSEIKGGSLFLQLAQSMPEVPFLAQLGRSAPVDGLELLPNVTLRSPEEDLSDVYAETAVLLMPSQEEPFGRVALEGALSGCLLLLHRAFGLREMPVPDFCFVDNLEPDLWKRRLSELLTSGEEVKAGMRERIREMALTYDPGWDALVEDLRLLMASEPLEGLRREIDTVAEGSDGARNGMRSIEEIFTRYFTDKLQTDGVNNSGDSWRCKLIVTGADAPPWIVETNDGRSRILVGDGQADATVTISATDLMDLVHDPATADFLRFDPGRLKIDGSFEVVSKLVRFFL